MARLSTQIRRQAASSKDGAARPSSPPPLPPSTLYRRSHSGSEDTRRTERTWARSRPSSQLQSVYSNRYAGDLHDTMQLSESVRARKARDDTTALVDFLKNHPPPPDNFMSIPYGHEEQDARGRWSKIKSIARRSKSMPREPQQIRLPDSAVAGVTMAGHRHIAISIPWEASPFGKDASSQNPVISHDMHVGTSSKDRVRTYKNKEGVVTVLRPVTELYETGQGTTGSNRRAPPYANSEGLQPPPLPPHKPKQSTGGPSHDYTRTLPRRFDTPMLDDGSAPWHIPRAPSRGEGQVQNGQNQQIFQRSAYPARFSSMTSSRATRGRNTPFSIDGAMQRQELPRNVPIIPRGRYCWGSHAVGQPALAINNNGAVDCGKNRHQWPNRSNALYSPDAYPILNQSGTQNCNPRSILDNGEDGPCHPTRVSMRSRKDVVRDKRRRDIEAMRHARLDDRNDQNELEHAQRMAQQPPMTHASFPNGNISMSTGTTSGANLTLSNLMVVMDLKPTSDSEAELDAPQVSETGASQQSAKEQEQPSLPSITVNEPSIPTPPSSAHGSPPQRHSASDRTSLTRRREWKAIREKERTAREAIAMAKAKAQHSASGDMMYEDGASSQANKEVLRLYEAYREHRLRDMERRLRRLERNGDVWLQSLVPALNTMSTSLATAGVQPAKDTRAWASDGEATGRAEGASGDAQKRRLTRRSSLSQCRCDEAG